MISNKEQTTTTKCFHCGEDCHKEYVSDGKSFCCFGCQTVYEILQSNNLGSYYTLNSSPGSTQIETAEGVFSYLDDYEISSRLLDFYSDDYARVTFKAPAIHCSSCIWLLENMPKLDPGVNRSRVNFTRKEIVIEYNPSKTSLGNIASNLKSIGYKPEINLKENSEAKQDHSLVLKLAVAGFFFGNIMLMSFPEYLGLGVNDAFLKNFFPWLNLALSIPVLLYSGSGYFRSAIGSIRQKQISIDVPIALGLTVIFLRSVWEISTGFGPGYLDSLSGLVFFLLIGRWFQNQTYQSLAFDRDFKSYFPLAVRKYVDGLWKPTVIYHLEKGDRIQVRNREIIPADARLRSPGATINYSFVTGESTPVSISEGDIIYAGGQSIGIPIELEVTRKTSQSQLTDLWNQEIFKKGNKAYRQLIDRIARVFTWAVLAISFATASYWLYFDASQAWLNVTAVLIVACPCALALATPFTYGTLMRVFGRHNFYLKNSDVGERMSEIDSFVFDKTGTLTHGVNPDVAFHGNLTHQELSQIGSLANLSTHPLSRIIAKAINDEQNYHWKEFKEIAGSGIEGSTNGNKMRIGSAEFTGTKEKENFSQSKVFVAINNEVRGYFSIRSSLRNNIAELFQFLGIKIKAILSGDTEAERSRFENITPSKTDLRFRQSAAEKMEYIKNLQQEGNKVMMFGDGLNDAGALKQSDIGVAVTDDTGHFTPACDAILKGSNLSTFPAFLRLSHLARKVLIAAFLLSFFYNIIALAFAITGNLSPLLAAILMPASSISVVAFCAGSIEFFGKLILDNK